MDAAYVVAHFVSMKVGSSGAWEHRQCLAGRCTISVLRSSVVHETLVLCVIGFGSGNDAWGSATISKQALAYRSSLTRQLAAPLSHPNTSTRA